MLLSLGIAGVPFVGGARHRALYLVLLVSSFALVFAILCDVQRMSVGSSAIRTQSLSCAGIRRARSSRSSVVMRTSVWLGVSPLFVG